MCDDEHSCPNCDGETKKTSFRTGSLSVPKRDEHHCGNCGCHAPAETIEPATEPSDD